VRIESKVELLNQGVLRPGRWDETAEKWAKTIPHDEPGDFSEFLRAMVADGRAKLADVLTDAGRVGFLIYAVTNFSGANAQKEMVLIAAMGDDAEHKDLTSEFLPQIEILAQSLGCKTVRFHTMRPGLVAKVRAHGYRVSEMILRKTLP
jgi:hypothetical protein